MNGPFSIVAALVLAAGVALAGYFVNDGLVNLRASARNVEVKGLAERHVEADIAIWEIMHSLSHENLQTAQIELKARQDKIKAFLTEHGIAPEEIKIERLSAYQSQTQDESVDGVIKYKPVYSINQTITARTDNIRAVEKAAQNTADLISEGILLNNSQPRYIFTRLNEVKPDMIAEATRNAREAALRFAEDSGSEVGPILRASQGWFNILPRNGGEYGEEEAIEKKVRVITTIDFLLVD